MSEDNKPGNLHEIKTPKDEVRAALDTLCRHEDANIEYVKMMARLRRAAYDELIKEGFTESQALELCKYPFGDGGY